MLVVQENTGTFSQGYAPFVLFVFPFAQNLYSRHSTVLRGESRGVLRNGVAIQGSGGGKAGEGQAGGGQHGDRSAVQLLQHIVAFHFILL